MFPITDREIRELVGKTVLQTRAARAIVRKSGFKPSSSGATRQGLGAPILATPPCVYASGGTASSPV